MKKQKLPMRILSTILAVMFIAEILPFTVWAAEYDDRQSVANADISAQTQEKSPIESEIISERDAYKKVFQRKDGSYTSIISPEPVHYYDDGEWNEIDNSLSESNGTLTNESNSFSVDLPSEIADGKDITINNGESGISFAMNNISSSDADVLNQPSQNLDETAQLMGLNNISSSVEYSNILTNTNLVYDINADSVKESIKLLSCPLAGQSYSYTISAAGCNLYLNEDKSINVVKNGQISFVIESPYMFDNTSESSDEISVTLCANADSTYTLTYTPDSAWLASADRAYPVTIDPTTRIYHANKIEDALIGTSSASQADLDNYYFIENDGENSTQLYLKYDNTVIGTASQNAVVTNVELSLYCQAMENDDTIGAYELMGDWNENSTSVVAHNGNLLDYNTITYGSSAARYVWNITEAAHKWALDLSDNHGVALMSYNDSDCNTKINRSLSTNYTTLRPWFEIDYTAVDNLANNDIQTVDMGRAGTFYLNKFTGTYYVKRNDLSLNGNVMPVDMSFTYDPYSYSTNENSYYGSYWLLDYFNKIFYSSMVVEENATRHQYYLWDTGATMTRFIEVLPTDSDYETVPDGKTASYLTDYTRYKAVYGDKDKCLWVPKTDTTYKDFANMIIEDSTYRYTIDSINRITSIVNKKSNAVIPVTFYTSASNSIYAITDGSGRKFTLERGTDSLGKVVADKLDVYNASNNLISIQTMSDSVTVGVDYGYQAVSSTKNYLTSITYADGEQVSYTYNTDGLLSTITNVDGSKLELRYVGRRISGYTKYATGNSFESRFDISFDSPSQRTFSSYNLDDSTKPYDVTIQRYNSKMETIGTVNSSGEFSYFKYENDNDTSSNLLSSSVNDDEAVNLLANGKFDTSAEWTFQPSNCGTIGTFDIDDENFTAFDNKAIHLNGGYALNSRAYQSIDTLTTNGEDEVYTVSAWAKSDMMSSASQYQNEYNHTSKTFALCVLDSEGNTVAQYDYDTNNCEWQFGAVSFKLSAGLTNAKVAVIFDNQPGGSLYADDIKLVKTTTSYVDSGLESDDTQLTPNGSGEETITVSGTTYRTSPCESCSCAQCTTPITVNYNGEDTTVYYNCNCDDESENATCNCLGCRQSAGNSTQTDSAYGLTLSQSQSNGTKSLNSVTNNYTSNYNYLASSVDSAGNSVYYNYNADTGLLDSYSDTSATSGMVNYTYNAVGALEYVSQTVSGLSGGTQMAALYTYSGDKITKIAHNGTEYNFVYNYYDTGDDYVFVGERLTQILGYNANNLVNEIHYISNRAVYYTYDKNNNISTISYNDKNNVVYRYEYENGALSKVYDYTNMLVSSYSNNLSSNSSLLSIKTFSVIGGEIVLGNTLLSSSYSAENKATTVSMFNSSYVYSDTRQTYNSLEDTVTSLSSVSINGGSILNHTTTTDFFNRKVSEHTTKNGSNKSIDTSYDYYGNETTATTQLKSVNVSNGNDTYIDEVYTYNSRGDIILVENSSGNDLYAYSYDEAGQLIAEYDFINHTATTYVYNAGGNIVSKTPYTNVTSKNLSTATAGTAIVYGYTNADCGDELTSYNGATVESDNSGNVTSCNDMSLEWYGHQLHRYMNPNFEQPYNSEINPYNMQVNYKYNSDGIITHEMAYNSTMNNEISYIWDNDRLVGYKNIFDYYSIDPLTDPLLFQASYDFHKTIEAKIHYDENNSPYAVTINGIDYYYVKNAAGNIKGLVNATTGEKVLSINTSAYGKVSFTYTNSICNEYNLGAVTGYSDIDTARIIQEIVNTLIFACVNFNGFHYDPYTKLYYAKDKVYDPEICRYLNAVDPGDLITKRTPIINSSAIDTSVSDVQVNNTTFNNASAKSIPIGTTPLNNNSFSYNKNNPVEFTDQSGESFNSGLPWLFTVAIGIVGALFRVCTIKDDIKDIFSVTESKLATALVTAGGYAPVYITSEIVSYIVKASIVTSLLDIVFGFVTACMTGTLSVGLRQIGKILLSAVLSFILPSLVISIQMIYYGFRYKKGCDVHLSFGGVEYDLK